jgi:hypothetical protein
MLFYWLIDQKDLKVTVCQHLHSYPFLASYKHGMRTFNLLI